MRGIISLSVGTRVRLCRPFALAIGLSLLPSATVLLAAAPAEAGESEAAATDVVDQAASDPMEAVKNPALLLSRHTHSRLR